MRDKLDRYYTPRPLAGALVGAIRLNEREPCRVLEPSVGGGAFLDFVSLHHAVFACDIDHNAEGLKIPGKFDSFVCDFLQLECDDVDWIIGNPPYSDAERHCIHAIKNARNGVAFLLRLGFLASAKRKQFWKEYPPTRVIVLSERPSFTGDGKTDGQEYAFFVWEKGAERMPIEWLDIAAIGQKT